jgi:transcription elongation GreA/GreB family factor
MTKMKLDKIAMLSETLKEEKRNLSQLKKWFTDLRRSNYLSVNKLIFAADVFKKRYRVQSEVIRQLQKKIRRYQTAKKAIEILKAKET